jgi:hypothetical protein
MRFSLSYTLLIAIAILSSKAAAACDPITYTYYDDDLKPHTTLADHAACTRPKRREVEWPLTLGHDEL